MYNEIVIFDTHFFIRSTFAARFRSARATRNTYHGGQWIPGWQTGGAIAGGDAAVLSLEGKRVFLACGHTDMRKSINGLAIIVESSFELDPFDGALFVFCNRNRNRVKILEWDTDGFWLHFKRLEKGRFKWPAPGADATMTLTGEELTYLLSGTRVELKLRRNEVFERKIS
jgi:hypothetical protein